MVVGNYSLSTLSTASWESEEPALLPSSAPAAVALPPPTDAAMPFGVLAAAVPGCRLLDDDCGAHFANSLEQHLWQAPPTQVHAHPPPPPVQPPAPATDPRSTLDTYASLFS